VPTHPYSPCLSHAPYSPHPRRGRRPEREREVGHVVVEHAEVHVARDRLDRRGERPPCATCPETAWTKSASSRSFASSIRVRLPATAPTGTANAAYESSATLTSVYPRTRARPRAAPRAARRRPRRSTDCARPRRGFCGERRQVVARALVRRAERADRDRTDEADSNEKDDGAVEDDRPRRHHADRRVDRREQLGTTTTVSAVAAMTSSAGNTNTTTNSSVRSSRNRRARLRARSCRCASIRLSVRGTPRAPRRQSPRACGTSGGTARAALARACRGRPDAVPRRGSWRVARR